MAPTELWPFSYHSDLYISQNLQTSLFLNADNRLILDLLGGFCPGGKHRVVALFCWGYCRRMQQNATKHPAATSQDRDLTPKQTGTRAERMLKTTTMKLLMKPLKQRKWIMAEDEDQTNSIDWVELNINNFHTLMKSTNTSKLLPSSAKAPACCLYYLFI